MPAFRFGDSVIFRKYKHSDTFKGFFVSVNDEHTSLVRLNISKKSNEDLWVMISSGGTVFNVERLETCRLVLVEKIIKML